MRGCTHARSNRINSPDRVLILCYANKRRRGCRPAKPTLRGSMCLWLKTTCSERRATCLVPPAGPTTPANANAAPPGQRLCHGPGDDLSAALEFTLKAGKYAYRDRRQKKRHFRQLWVTRLNAALKQRGVNYSRFIPALVAAGIELNRKMLSELAITDPAAFDAIVEKVRPHLAQPKPRPPLKRRGRASLEPLGFRRADGCTLDTNTARVKFPTRP